MRGMFGIFKPPLDSKIKFLKSCIDRYTRFLEKNNFLKFNFEFFQREGGINAIICYKIVVATKLYIGY